MERGLIQGNSLEYFKNKEMKISLVLTSPSYYTSTPKRNKKDHEIGIGEDKDTYINLISNVIKDLSMLLIEDGKIIMIVGRYEKSSIEPIILSIEDKLKDVGLVLNNVKYFDQHNSECLIVFSKKYQKIDIPNFDNLQIYNKVGFFGEISPKILDWAINEHSNEGDLVVDPFAGAGSTVKAAISRHREALGIELNKDFIN